MKKKVYVKPSMEVYPLNQHPQILAGSYNHDVGYVPGIDINDEMNKLA